MTVESAADRLAFLSDFGVSVLWNPSTGSDATITGIFDNLFYEATTNAEVAYASAQPRLLIRTADKPAAGATGDILTVSSTNYTLRGIEDDGTGMTILVLEKV